MTDHPPDPLADAQRIGEIRLAARAYFDKGRCSGHEQFNGRYCRDAAGPDRWCIHCAGFMLLQRVEQAEAQRAEQAVSLAHWQHCHGVTAGKLVEAESALAAARQEVADQKRLFQAHTAAVGTFLNSLYAVLVDPLAEGEIAVDAMKKALLDAAVRGRDAAIRYEECEESRLTADLAAARLRGREERERLTAQAVEVSTALSDAGCSPIPIPQAVRTLIAARDVLAKERDYLRDVVAEQAHAITEKIAARDAAVKERDREKHRTDLVIAEFDAPWPHTHTVAERLSNSLVWQIHECRAGAEDRAEKAEAEIARLSSQLAGMREAVEQSEAELVVAIRFMNEAGTDPLAWIEGVRDRLAAALHAAQGSPTTKERIMNLTAEDYEQIAEGIENFIMDGAPVVDSAWQPYVDKLRAAALGNEGSPTRPDVRAIVEALGFDPTNHHNALVCAYCNPDKLVLGSPTKDEGPHG